MNSWIKKRAEKNAIYANAKGAGHHWVVYTDNAHITVRCNKTNPIVQIDNCTFVTNKINWAVKPPENASTSQNYRTGVDSSAPLVKDCNFVYIGDVGIA